jgi:hypothetical protein
MWERAFINDLSGITRINGATWPLTSGGGGTSDFSGLDITTNLVPRDPLSIDLGSSSKYWNNAYINTANVTTLNLAGTIAGSKITTETITSTQIQNNTIMNVNINSGANITFSKIDALLAINNSHIATNADIHGSKIQDGTINGLKLEPTTITAAKITDFTITGDKIQRNAITGGNVFSGPGDAGSKIAALTIVNENISNTADIDGGKLRNNIPGSKITSGTITSTQIADGTIVDGDISANAAINGSKISGNIAGSKINVNTITEDRISGTINGSKISGGTITNANITIPVSGTITIPSGANILTNGVTVSAAQLAFLFNVSSNIQTQIDNLAARITALEPQRTGWYGDFTIEGSGGNNVSVTVEVYVTNPTFYLFNENLGTTLTRKNLPIGSRLANTSSKLFFSLVPSGSTNLTSVSITGGSFNGSNYNFSTDQILPTTPGSPITITWEGVFNP